ncbi:MAG: PAS domain-containing protein [Thermodesulfobacteriota bacterium]
MPNTQGVQSSKTSQRGADRKSSRVGGGPTHTIDFDGPSGKEIEDAACFDPQGIGSTPMGMLLDALPLSVMVVDQLHYVIFANRFCRNLNPSPDNFRGKRFVDLFLAPKDSNQAAILAHKAVRLMERVWEERRPQVAEAILRFEKKRIWCRIHLRAVKVCSSRYALVMIEDLTWERIYGCIKKREHTELVQANLICERRARKLAADLEQALSGQIHDSAEAAESSGLFQLSHTHADMLIHCRGNGPSRGETG